MEVDEIVVISLRKNVDRQAMARKQIPEGVQWNFYFADPDPDGGRAGCYRSHAEVLRAAKKHGARRLLVLEDDFRLLFDWTEVCRQTNEAMAQLEREDPQWAFLLPGMHALNVDQPEGYVRRVTCASGAHAYVANVAHCDIPLPSYSGRSIDQALFCDYYCDHHRPAGLDDEVFGANAVIVSQTLNSKLKGCNPRSDHVYATSVVVIHIHIMKSDINRWHEAVFHAEHLVGADGLADIASYVDVGWLYGLFFLLFFVLAVGAGAWLARRFPARNMHILALTMVVCNAALVLRSGWTDNKFMCSYPCYLLWRMHVTDTLLLSLLVAMALSYVLVSSSGAIRITELLSVIMFTMGLFLLALTVADDNLHLLATILTYTGSVFFGFFLFKIRYAVAFFCYIICFLFSALIKKLYWSKTPLRQNLEFDDMRCMGAKALLMGWFIQYGLFAVFAMLPYTWRGFNKTK